LAAVEQDQFTLTSTAASVTIDPAAGGRVASLVVHGVELLVDREDDPVMWGCYPMVPFAGRVAHGQFSFDGIDIDVPRNFGDHAMHGFGFTSPWQRNPDDSIALTLGDPWPFAGHITQHFALDDQRLTMTMRAIAHERQPMMLGWHPWFRKSNSLGEAELIFEPGAMFERADDGIPTGALIDPAPRPWDDCFTDVVTEPSLSWGNLRLQFSSKARHWVIFDELEHAICVEPQTDPPNAFNTTPTVLDEGHELSVDLTLDWSMT